MKHFASQEFRLAYGRLPASARAVADKNFALLKTSPQHPSLHFKKVGHLWSVRARLRYRALATEVDGGFLWFWIGSHADYDAIVG